MNRCHAGSLDLAEGESREGIRSKRSVQFLGTLLRRCRCTERALDPRSLIARRAKTEQPRPSGLGGVPSRIALKLQGEFVVRVLPRRGVWTFFRPGAASRRDRTIVAWHEVPGKVYPRDPSRRVRRDRRYRDGLVADARICTHPFAIVDSHFLTSPLLRNNHNLCC
jgi:hypothetical protein